MKLIVRLNSLISDNVFFKNIRGDYMISSFQKKRIKKLEADFVRMLEEYKAQFYRIAYSYVKNEQDHLMLYRKVFVKGIVHYIN